MAQISSVDHFFEEDGMVKKVFVGSKKHALYFMLTLVVRVSHSGVKRIINEIGSASECQVILCGF